MISKIVKILIFNLLSFQVFAQIDNFNFYESQFFDTQDSNSVFLRIENTNFLKNNEYFAPQNQGFTLTGFFLKPSLLYFPSKNVKIEAGIFAIYYSGKENFKTILPLYRLHYQRDWFNLILGNIYGNLSHNLIEPLYFSEQYFSKHIENGIQFLFRKKFVETDIWLNWEKFIEPKDSFQEEFTIGNTNIFHLSKNFEIPLQFIGTHQGGQINSNKDVPLRSLINSSTGICFSYQFLNSYSLDFQDYIISYNDISPSQLFHFRKGFANYALIKLRNQRFEVLAGFWKGKNFFAPRGESLFFSISRNDSTYYQKDKQIFSFKINYNTFLLKDISLTTRFESYYDVSDKRFDFSFGIFVFFRDKFLLKKFNF